MADESEEKIFIIAGTNGAGKISFAAEFLPNEAHCPAFINADLIAVGLTPFRPNLIGVRAGRLVLGRIRESLSRGESFTFETTLSGCGYPRRIPRWRKQGYRVKLFFLRLPTPELAIARIAQRVLEGGHDVPEAIIRRRFHAGRRNFERLSLTGGPYTIIPKLLAEEEKG